MLITVLLCALISIISLNAFQIHRFSTASSNMMKINLKSKSNRYQITKLYLGSEFERTPPKIVAKEEDEVVASISEKAEVKEEPKKDISDSMKEKLRRELVSQGADPNYSAGPILGNPILLISGVVAILVLLGGKDFFF